MCGVVVCATIAAAVTVAMRWGRQGSDGFGGPWANQSQPGLVLLVPGYGGRKGALDTLAGRLRAAGRQAQVVTLPGDGTGDLTVDAGVLQADIVAAIAVGAPSVDLVGYSAGGVVVRLWLNRYRRLDEVRRIVTLGSPLHGTSLAGLAAFLFAGPDCPIACRQLAPFCELIRGLNTVPIPARLPWLSIWSSNDTTVLPPTSARLTGAVNVAAQQVCPGDMIAHSRLPTDAEVAGMVIEAFAGPPLTRAPSRSDCARLQATGAPVQP